MELLAVKIYVTDTYLSRLKKNIVHVLLCTGAERSRFCYRWHHSCQVKFILTGFGLTSLVARREMVQLRKLWILMYVVEKYGNVMGGVDRVECTHSKYMYSCAKMSKQDAQGL